VSRRGLPGSIAMRHDEHYVEALAASAGTPVGRMIPIEQIDPNPNQPRQVMGDLSELIASIAEKGIIEPIVVRHRGERFQIRWHTAWSLWPGRLEVRDLQLSGRAGSQRWRVDVFFALLAVGITWMLWLHAPRRDIGAAYLACGLLLGWAMLDLRVRRLAVLAGAFWLGLHALVHLYEVITGICGVAIFWRDFPGVFGPPALALLGWWLARR